MAPHKSPSATPGVTLTEPASPLRASVDLPGLAPTKRDTAFPDHSEPMRMGGTCPGDASLLMPKQGVTGKPWIPFCSIQATAGGYAKDLHADGRV